jgi:outer membrane protein assembly factor BamB
MGPQVRAEAWVTGAVNNAVRVDGDMAWVVQSGDNTIGRLVLSSGEFRADFIDVGNGRNPWDALGVGQRVYISNLLTGSVTVADRATGQVLGEVVDEYLLAPAGLAADGARLFVSSSGFVGPDYETPAVVVFEILESSPWIRRTSVLVPGGMNTLHVQWDEVRDALYAVSGGETVFGAGGVEVASDPVITRFSGPELETQDALVLTRAPGDKSSGGASDLLISGGVAYLPSRVAPHIYKIDLEEWAVLRGPKNPIAAYLGEGNQLTSMALARDGRAYVTAFNQDALYVFDTSCDATVAGPFDVGKSDFLEGPIALAYDRATRRALVLLSVSNSMTEVLDP